ncbi:MAG: EamA family transporter, partial [Bacteroidales bacterium]
LGLAGAVIMVLSGKNSSASGNIWGITLCLISGISYAIYLTAFRNLISRYKPVTIMKWMFLFSSMVSLPFLYGSVSEIDYANLPLKAYLELAYVVVGATFITYMLIPVAQKALRPTVLSVYNYVQPITTALLALILGMDSFTWVKALAAALVFLGVYVVTQSKSKAQLDAERNIKR